MATRAPEPAIVDEVQLFSAAASVDAGDDVTSLREQVEMAISSNCEISVMHTPAGGTSEIPADPLADRILLLLKGECTVEGPSRKRPLGRREGALVPAGVACRVVNEGEQPLVFFALRSILSDTRPGYVPNVPSGVLVRFPEKEIAARGLQHHLFVYALNDETIGISAFRLDELNLASILRMNCGYERSGDDLVVNLPERLVRWYGLRGMSESDYRIIPSKEKTYVRLDISPLVQREAAARAERG